MGRPRLASESKVISIRLPIEILNLLDSYAEDLRASNPGLNITRTDAARTIITCALTKKVKGEKKCSKK